MMASTTVRVSEHTHELLHKLAAATGEPLQKVLERAVEHYRREQFYAEFNAAFERLKADPVAWEEELAERAEWDATLADGLDDR
jgi:predicted transcriptional regulator